jgi:hypothetical protein
MPDVPGNDLVKFCTDSPTMVRRDLCYLIHRGLASSLCDAGRREPTELNLGRSCLQENQSKRLKIPPDASKTPGFGFFETGPE